ncbi:MAG: hypothetical protein LBR57_01635 [Alistipes sp.]|jgi:hypothetical protein|nr:hypothetical protein [Alistipes sp.]
MNLIDTFTDRRSLSTDTNEYATGLNDENEWEEDIVDYDIPIDDILDDYLAGETDDSRYLYNERGYMRDR